MDFMDFIIEMPNELYTGGLVAVALVLAYFTFKKVD
jgi:hypothetical protein